MGEGLIGLLPFLWRKLMNELYHFNHNHDPRTGKFTFSRGGSRNYIGAGGSGREGKVTKRDIKRAKKQRKKESREFRNISDEELQRRIARLQAEQRYKQLSGEDVHSGKEFAKEMAKLAAKTAVTKTTNQSIDTTFKQLQKNLDITKEDIDKAKAAAVDARENSESKKKSKRLSKRGKKVVDESPVMSQKYTNDVEPIDLESIFARDIKVMDLNDDKKSLKGETYVYPEYVKKKK